MNIEAQDLFNSAKGFLNEIEKQNTELNKLEEELNNKMVEVRSYRAMTDKKHKEMGLPMTMIKTATEGEERMSLLILAQDELYRKINGKKSVIKWLSNKYDLAKKVLGQITAETNRRDL